MDRLNTFKLFIETHKNKIIASVAFIIISIGASIFFFNVDKKVKTKTDSIVFENSNIEKEEIIENDNLEYIYVDIKGEVSVPGVYSISNDKRVVDAINLAGGFKENADTSLLNLSMKLKDQMVIIVYSKEEVNNIKNEETEEIIEEKDICNIPIQNDSCIINTVETVVIPELKNDLDISKDLNTKININTASKEELITLPKIGNVKADAIISYRKDNGNFNSIDEIKNVKGIGDSLFEAIKDYITI